jgi:hypothetical protein
MKQATFLSRQAIQAYSMWLEVIFRKNWNQVLFLLWNEIKAMVNYIWAATIVILNCISYDKVF